MTVALGSRDRPAVCAKAGCGGPAVFWMWRHKLCGACCGQWFDEAAAMDGREDFGAYTDRWVAEALQEREVRHA